MSKPNNLNLKENEIGEGHKVGYPTKGDEGLILSSDLRGCVD